MSDATFSSTYYVKMSDAATVKKYVIDSLTKGERPVLFRFAVTDFYASTARFDKHDLALSAKDGYVAQETVFLDFDVISLTFRDEKSVDKVIPVCASPIDIINGTEAPGDLGGGIGGGKDKGFLDNLADLIATVILGFAAIVIVYLVIRLYIWAIKRLINGKDDDPQAIVVYMPEQKGK